MANCVHCGRKLPPFTFGKKICKWCVGYYAAQNGEATRDELQPVMPVPWVRAHSGPTVTMVLVGLNFLVFVGMALAGVSLMNPTSEQLIHWGANFGPLTLTGQWWRLLSNVFVHIGVLHIAFNMWCLWDLGALAESLYGKSTFIAIYLMAGVGGSLASLWWHPAILSAGASGAIFGIAGALIASLYLGEFNVPRAAISGTLRSVVIFVGYNLVFGAVSGRTDNAAHIGGFLSGLALGAAIAKMAPDRRDLVRRGSAIVLVGLLLFGAGTWVRKTHAYVVYAQRGSSLLQAGNKEEAISDLRTALQLRPSYSEARHELATAYSLSGRFAEAESELKRILEQNPQDDLARYELGWVYLESGRPAEARDAFTAFLSTHDSEADGHTGLGRALAGEGRQQAAIEEYKKAIALNPRSGYAYYCLGLSYTSSGLYGEAVSALRTAQQLAGDDRDAEAALAAAYRGLGKPQEAEAARQKAEQMNNNEE